MKKYILLIIIASLVIVFDQWTKALIIESFRLGETLPVWRGFFNLTYVQNSGAAFGILANAPAAFRIPFFLIVPVIALGIIIFVFRKISDKRIDLVFALSMVLGGAVGNLIDRVMLGKVVDFIDFHWKYRYHFPAFNIADAAICVGVGILILDLLRKEPELVDEKNTEVGPV